jgi:hypothetical protein
MTERARGLRQTPPRPGVQRPLTGRTRRRPQGLVRPSILPWATERTGVPGRSPVGPSAWRTTERTRGPPARPGERRGKIKPRKPRPRHEHPTGLPAIEPTRARRWSGAPRRGQRRPTERTRARRPSPVGPNAQRTTARTRRQPARPGERPGMIKPRKPRPRHEHPTGLPAIEPTRARRRSGAPRRGQRRPTERTRTRSQSPLPRAVPQRRRERTRRRRIPLRPGGGGRATERTRGRRRRRRQRLPACSMTTPTSGASCSG